MTGALYVCSRFQSQGIKTLYGKEIEESVVIQSYASVRNGVNTTSAACVIQSSQ